MIALATTGSLVVGALSLVDAASAQQPSSGAAAPNSAPEYTLKLARMYATARYVSWPDDAAGATAPFVIAALDPDPFNGGLEKLAARKVRERPIRIVHVKSANDLPKCHLLFIPAAADPALVADAMKAVAGQPVLVWRDQADPAGAAGVSCHFARQGDSLVIELDPAELKRRKLVPNGQLLSLNLVKVIKPAN